MVKVQGKNFISIFMGSPIIKYYYKIILNFGRNCIIYRNTLFRYNKYIKYSYVMVLNNNNFIYKIL